jgi:hypothetical protein
MFLDDMADYLTSQGHGPKGTDIFLSYLREDVTDPTTCLYETEPPPAVHGMGPSLTKPLMVRLRLQVVNRGTPQGYEAARLRSHRAHHSLEGLVDRTINGRTYAYVHARQSEPFLMSRDKNGRPLIACNYDVWAEPSTST